LDEVEHERRVTRIATRLFELTEPLHRLGDGDLRLLQTAAIVHDVGRSICDETHHLDGANLLLNDSDLPLGFAERRHLAYLTRYHKGSVPDAGRDNILHRSDDADRLLRILALLRSADALDSRKIGAARLIFALKGRNKVRVTCYVKADLSKARKVFMRRKKYRLMEEVFGCQVDVDVANASQLALVA
jgi:exopolyphosphatase/guanosine-5'-triphosphate,3'-diphosphate pyrophosphatase